MAWALAVLALAVTDVSRIHYFENVWQSIWTISLKCVIRFGYIGLGCVTYVMIGRMFSGRMIVCEKEKTPTISEVADDITQESKAVIAMTAEKVAKELVDTGAVQCTKAAQVVLARAADVAAESALRDTILRKQTIKEECPEK